MIDLGRTAGPQSLVVCGQGEDIRIFRGIQHAEIEDAKVGVVTVILRDYRKNGVSLAQENQSFFDNDIKQTEFDLD